MIEIINFAKSKPNKNSYLTTFNRRSVDTEKQIQS
jgi:hypothetical protein